MSRMDGKKTHTHTQVIYDNIRILIGQFVPKSDSILLLRRYVHDAAAFIVVYFTNRRFYFNHFRLHVDPT